MEAAQRLLVMERMGAWTRAHGWADGCSRYFSPPLLSSPSLPPEVGVWGRALLAYLAVLAGPTPRVRGTHVGKQKTNEVPWGPMPFRGMGRTTPNRPRTYATSEITRVIIEYLISLGRDSVACLRARRPRPPIPAPSARGPPEMKRSKPRGERSQITRFLVSLSGCPVLLDFHFKCYRIPRSSLNAIQGAQMWAETGPKKRSKGCKTNLGPPAAP